MFEPFTDRLSNHPNISFLGIGGDNDKASIWKIKSTRVLIIAHNYWFRLFIVGKPEFSYDFDTNLEVENFMLSMAD